MSETTKRCSTCGQDKPFTAYGTRGAGKSLRSQCRACVNERVRARVYPDIAEKTCITCQRTLSIVFFYKRSTSDGYSHHCVTCERPRLRRYYANKKRKALMQSKAFGGKS